MKHTPLTTIAAVLFMGWDAHAVITCHDLSDSDYVVADADYPALVNLFEPSDCIGTLVHESYLLTVAIVKMAPDRASGWIHKAISLRRANGGGFENTKALLLEAANCFQKMTQSNTTWRATAPNWVNWMPRKSI